MASTGFAARGEVLVGRVGKLLQLQRLHEAAQERRLDRADGDVAPVLGAEMRSQLVHELGLVEHLAFLPRLVPHAQAWHDPTRERVGDGHVEVLALLRAGAAVQRAKDAHERVHGRSQVAHGNAYAVVGLAAVAKAPPRRPCPRS